MANSAELYDPTTGNWTATGSMRSGRTNHAAVLLRSGKVLVAGGVAQAEGGASPSVSTGEAIASAEVYDPESGTWTETSSMPVAADSLTAIVLESGKVFVAPGLFVQRALTSSSTPLNLRAELTTHAAELYDPVSNTWSAIGGLIEPLASATLLPSGKVLVLNPFSDTAQLYDPPTGSWSSTAGITTIRDWRTHTATLLPSGKVLVVGGPIGDPIASAEIFDPAMDTWIPTSAVASPHIDGADATLLPFGKVLVAGGGSGAWPKAVDSVDLYDPATANWTASGVMAAARTFFTATLMPSGAVLYAGGADAGNGVFSSAEIYAALTCN